MELLIDTDFIVKMGRYGLLEPFVDLMTANGHIPPPFRYLFEIRTILNRSKGDPTRSVFASHKAWNAAWSFVADGLRMDGPQDYTVLEALDEIPGIDAGEKLLVEYSMRTSDTVIVTGDKRFADAMSHPKAKPVRAILKGRIIHMEHLIFALGSAKTPQWSDLRELVCAVPNCDAALHSLLEKSKKEPDAIADLWKSTRGLNSRSIDTMPAPLCPPFKVV